MVQVVALCYQCRHQDKCPVYRSLDDLCRAVNESLPDTARDFFENELPTLLPVVETCEKFEEGITQGSPLPDPSGKPTPDGLSTPVSVSSEDSVGNKAMPD
jgi:hypothetical protein